MQRLGKKQLEQKKSLFWPLFSGSGATCLFMFFCIALYFHGMHKKSEICAELQGKIRELESLRRDTLEEREDLVLQMNSQNDQDWIEMVLKKRLGVVPEGQVKVYFKKDE